MDVKEITQEKAINKKREDNEEEPKPLLTEWK